jgi:hypothetical protein
MNVYVNYIPVQLIQFDVKYLTYRGPDTAMANCIAVAVYNAGTRARLDSILMVHALATRGQEI